MMQPASAIRRGAVAALATTLALTSSASADFRSSFKKGIQASEQERWEEVAAAMREAIADRPAAQKTRVPIYGSKTVVYIPNTMLGIALAKMNQCADAWQYFEKAEAQRVAQTHDKDRWGTMVQERTSCNEQLVQESIARVSPILEEAEGIRKAVEEQRLQPGVSLVWNSKPTMDIGFSRGKDHLETANVRVREGIANGNFQAIANALPPAKTALSELKAVRKDLNVALKSGINTRLAESRQKVQDAEGASRQVDARRAELGGDWTAQLTQAQSRAQKTLEQAKTELAAGASGNDGAKLARASQLASQAEGDFRKVLERASTVRIAKADLEPPARNDPPRGETPRNDEPRARDPQPEPPPTVVADNKPRDIQSPPATGALPKALTDAATAYFAGRYEDVLGLEADSIADATAKGQAHLFRAAAAFALFRMSGGEETERLERASAEVQALRRIAPQTRPSERYFPPTFHKFFDGGR